mgnify:CR=1 FL=1
MEIDIFYTVYYLLKVTFEKLKKCYRQKTIILSVSTRYDFYFVNRDF